MSQLSFDYLDPVKTQAHISREKDKLLFPESIHTIPYTHGMHRFPGKYVPNIPRYLIETYLSSSKRIICDPFCGSGTTLIEAALKKKAFLGIDIDPLGVFITQAKTLPLNPSDIIEIEKHWKSFDAKLGRSFYIPPVDNISHWFTESSVEQLSAIKSHCLELPGALQRFCLVVFSSIIRRVSNADDQTQKTYVSHTLLKNPPSATRLFPIHLRRALQGMREYIEVTGGMVNGIVKVGDARELTSSDDIDIITSPPYIDSIDYPYNQMLEYYWLLPELRIKNLDGFRRLRKIAMGFRHSDIPDMALNERLAVENRNELLAARKTIKSISKKEEANVISFFKDFVFHAEAVSNIQQSGATYCLIIGQSVVRGVQIQTGALLKDILLSAGYNLKDRMYYEIKRHYMKFPRRSNSGKITRDQILIFTKR